MRLLLVVVLATSLGRAEANDTETPPLSGRLVFAEVLAGSFIGFLGTLGGAGAGLGTIAILDAQGGGCDDEYCAYRYMAWGAYAGWAAAVPLGVYLAGSDDEQTGSVGWTFAGSFTGAGLGMLAMAMTENAGAGVFAVTAPVVGAMIGFNATRRYRTRIDGTRVVPVAAMTGGGATFGLAGTF